MNDCSVDNKTFAELVKTWGLWQWQAHKGWLETWDSEGAWGDWAKCKLLQNQWQLAAKFKQGRKGFLFSELIWEASASIIYQQIEQLIKAIHFLNISFDFNPKIQIAFLLLFLFFSASPIFFAGSSK